jgi:hypothetical protein
MAAGSVSAKGTPEAQLRSLIEKFDPRDQRLIRSVRSAVRADGVRLYFMHGPQLPDPKKLLMGSGKQTRFIRVEAAKQLAHPDVEALIAAAIDRAGVPLPSRGRGTLVIKSTAATKRPRRKPAK